MDEIIILLGLAGIIISFIFGRALDQTYKAKIYRQIFKKRNYIVVGIVSKDNKTVKEVVVNAEGDVIRVGNKVWIIEQGRIYRKDKTNEGFFFADAVPIKGEDGKPDFTTLTPKKDIVRWNEGVPIVYVDEDHLKPLDYFKDENNLVKPEGVGATLNSWNINQQAKQLLGTKKTDLTTWLLVGGIVLVLILSWTNFTGIEDLKNSGISCTAAQNQSTQTGADGTERIVIGQPAGG